MILSPAAYPSTHLIQTITNLATSCSTPFYGPYLVLSHTNNTVEFRHLIIDNLLRLPVDKLKLYVGTEPEGYEAAK